MAAPLYITEQAYYGACITLIVLSGLVVVARLFGGHKKSGRFHASDCKSDLHCHHTGRWMPTYLSILPQILLFWLSSLWLLPLRYSIFLPKVILERRMLPASLQLPVVSANSLLLQRSISPFHQDQIHIFFYGYVRACHTQRFSYNQLIRARSVWQAR